MADLTTLANVKEFLSITNASSDALIRSLITRISVQIENFVERPILVDDYTEITDGRENNRGHLMVEQFPINSIDTLHDDDNRVYDASSLIPAADYVFEASYGVVKLTDGAVFDVGIHNVKIVYNAGFADIPGDIEQVAIDLVDRKLHNAGRQNLKSEKLGRWAAAYGAELPEDVKEVLARYKKREFDIV